MDVGEEKVNENKKIQNTRSVKKKQPKLKPRSKINPGDSSNSLLSEISQAGIEKYHHL